MDAPQARRCFAVLDRSGHPGRILTDDPSNPTWVAVQEGYDGVTYLEGKLDPSIVAAIFARLLQAGEVLVCLYADDPRVDLLPPNPDYEGWVLEFYDRPAGRGLETIIAKLPDDCLLRRLDRDLILRTQWGPDDVKFAGGLDAWEADYMGYALMRDDVILCESTVGPPSIGLYEPGVITHEDHRGQGYATITCARLVQEIETNGLATYWNCNESNVASAAVARKLGYRIEKRSRVFAWQEQKLAADGRR
jgi:GNAT superfamily N-acetyltransferase